MARKAATSRRGRGRGKAKKVAEETEEVPETGSADVSMESAADNSTSNENTETTQVNGSVTKLETMEDEPAPVTDPVTDDNKQSMIDNECKTGESEVTETMESDEIEKITTEERTTVVTEEPAQSETTEAPKPEVPKKLTELEKFWKPVKEDSTDFTGWTYLLQYVDSEDDVESAREAYNAFFLRYPYCYGYWKKFADYEKKKGNKEECEKVFERGLKAIALSVDLWVHYLNYIRSTYGENEEFIRSQFERAISVCGLEFRSSKLWDNYINWETEGKHYINVVNIYNRLLAVPNQNYNGHFEKLQEFIKSHVPKDLVSVDEFLTLRKEVLDEFKCNSPKESPKAEPTDEDVPPGLDEAPPGIETNSKLPKPDEETAALQEKIIAEKKKIHEDNEKEVSKRWTYEEGVKRPYFHVKPLEKGQLKNWKEYLDWEINEGNKERILVLFERCLIATALYEEFWLKFIKYLEGINDDHERIRENYRRACEIHLRDKPAIHLQWAAYEEKLGHHEKADDILAKIEKVVPNMIQLAYRRINLERRRGNLDNVEDLYKHYIGKLSKVNKSIGSNMSIKFARFVWKYRNDVDRAISILEEAITNDKANSKLYMQLVDFGLQKDPIAEAVVMGAFDRAIGGDNLSVDQKVLFSQRKIEFMEDFCDDIGKLQECMAEHYRLAKPYQDLKRSAEEHAEEQAEKKIRTHYNSSVTSQPAKTYQQKPAAYQQPVQQYNYQQQYQQDWSQQQWGQQGQWNYSQYAGYQQPATQSGYYGQTQNYGYGYQ